MNQIKINSVHHLPHCSATHASIHHATKFKICTESMLSAPKSAVIDGIISYGGSTGIGLNLPRKAYGEYFERNHLFTAVPIDEKKPLSRVEPLAFQNKLLTLCSQNPKTSEVNQEHPFSLTKVHNLFDNKLQDYFYNAISLNGLKEDAPYLGYCDSCACASHPIKQKALYNSMMEFLERQALLGSWLSQTCQYAINPALLKDITPYSDLTDKLLENGSLHIFANGNQLPGHSVIMFYFAHSEKDMVQYSIGASSGLSLQEALISSLEELYQCYTFLYNMECSSGLENKAGSGYHLSFQQCNYRGVKETIPFFKQPVPLQISTLDELHAVRIFSYQNILTELEELTTDIYYYHFYDRSLNLHFTKIMSPDFFAHMSLTKTLNFENLYAKKLGITRGNAYLAKIPFP